MVSPLFEKSCMKPWGGGGGGGGGGGVGGGGVELACGFYCMSILHFLACHTHFWGSS